MTEYRSKEWLASLLGERPYIAYHPRWNALTGSPLASILLHQILYHWWRFGRRPFWKYSAPCPASQPGETWVEELAFSQREFRRARRQIARKVMKGDSRARLLEQWLVIYWTDARRLTWYEVNELLLARRFAALGAQPGTEADPPNADCGIELNANSVNSKMAHYVISKNANCENGEKAEIHVTGETPITWSEKKNKPPDQKTRDISLSQKGEASEVGQAEAAAGDEDPGALPARSEPALTSADERPPDTAAALLWESVLGELRLQVDGATFDRWLARSYALRLEEGVMRVGVTNAAAKEWLEHRLARLVERTLGYVAPDTRVEFVVEEP